MPAATKKRPPLEMEPGEGKAHESAESAAEETREGAEPDDASKAMTNRKRSAKGVKSTKAPMDGDCGCGGKKGASCDGNCGGYAKKMDRSDALTPQEYLAACDLGVQGRSRTYIRARLDAAERLDLKCGKGSISQGEKCSKGPATKPQGPSAAVQVGQAAKGVGRGVLEAGKWLVGSTLLSGVSGGLGAARRVDAFGLTDLQQHAQNEKKEKAWRKSVGYKDGGGYAKGFSIDYAQLGM